MHLVQLDFLRGRENVVRLGPPGIGKTHLAIALGMRASLAGHRVLFATAAESVARLLDAQCLGHLAEELRRLGRVPLVVVDEVGYVPFDPEAAKLMFLLVSSRYERASLVMTSNKPFSAWGEVFGDGVVATAMIDRLVHHDRDPLAQGRQLPAQRQRRRRGTHSSTRLTHRGVGHFSTRRRRVTFRPPLTPAQCHQDHSEPVRKGNLHWRTARAPCAHARGRAVTEGPCGDDR